MRKGQGATEYLIILAVVVVIALILIGVLGGIPGIGGNAGSQTSSAYWASQEVGISSQALSANTGATDKVVLKNNAKNAVTVNDIVINGVDLAAGETVGPGQTREYTGGVANCTAGQAYSYKTWIVYTDSVTGGTFNVTGENL